MGRRPQSKLGVAEAKLYGSRCRVIDLSWRKTTDRTDHDETDANEAVAEATAEVIALGGDPNNQRLFPSHGVYSS